MTDDVKQGPEAPGGEESPDLNQKPQAESPAPGSVVRLPDGNAEKLQALMRRQQAEQQAAAKARQEAAERDGRGGERKIMFAEVGAQCYYPGQQVEWPSPEFPGADYTAKQRQGNAVVEAIALTRDSCLLIRLRAAEAVNNGQVGELVYSLSTPNLRVAYCWPRPAGLPETCLMQGDQVMPRSLLTEAELAPKAEADPEYLAASEAQDLLALSEPVVAKGGILDPTDFKKLHEALKNRHVPGTPIAPGKPYTDRKLRIAQVLARSQANVKAKEEASSGSVAVR